MYYGYYYDPTYLLVIIGFLITLGAQILVNSRYSKYKKIKNTKSITGYDVARKILDNNQLQNIDIVKVSGDLSDHYDPTKKIVRLSNDIFDGTSIAAMAVASHECGHAIQDKEGYALLRIRSKIVPTVNFCSKLGYVVIAIGLLFGFYEVAMIGFILLCAILLFQLITLPVEFNASKRAKEQLMALQMSEDRDDTGVKNMLTAAAMTYVASLTSTLLQMFRMFLIINSNRRDD